jgi:hypothetical protein
VFYPGFGEDSGEGTGAVAGAVIGEHPLDFDASSGKRGDGVEHECRRGFLGFVGQDLGVNEPGMVIHCVMQE